MFNAFQAAKRQKENEAEQERQKSLLLSAEKKARRDMLADTYRQRVESWIEKEADTLPRSDSVFDDNPKVAAHHQFRDRLPKKELGSSFMSSTKYEMEKDRIRKSVTEAKFLSDGPWQAPDFSLRDRDVPREIQRPMRFKWRTEGERVRDKYDREGSLLDTSKEKNGKKKGGEFDHDHYGDPKQVGPPFKLYFKDQDPSNHKAFINEGTEFVDSYRKQFRTREKSKEIGHGAFTSVVPSNKRLVSPYGYQASLINHSSGQDKTYYTAAKDVAVLGTAGASVGSLTGRDDNLKNTAQILLSSRF